VVNVKLVELVDSIATELGPMAFILLIEEIFKSIKSLNARVPFSRLYRVK
jgi:hypothetical protein